MCIVYFIDWALLNLSIACWLPNANTFWLTGSTYSLFFVQRQRMIGSWSFRNASTKSRQSTVKQLDLFITFNNMILLISLQRVKKKVVISYQKLLFSHCEPMIWGHFPDASFLALYHHKVINLDPLPLTEGESYGTINILRAIATWFFPVVWDRDRGGGGGWWW